MIIYTEKNKTPFQIDEEYYEIVSHYNWWVTGGYIATGLNGDIVYLHILLFGKALDGLEWDHYNRDKFDNRKENLRQVPSIVNRRNRSLYKNNASGYVGISITSSNKYHVRIQLSGQTFHLGTYNSIEEAIRVRKDAENKYWKDLR